MKKRTRVILTKNLRSTMRAGGLLALISGIGFGACGGEKNMTDVDKVLATSELRSEQETREVALVRDKKTKKVEYHDVTSLPTT